MADGTPVNRQWILVLKEGDIVVDWGDNVFQNIRSGEFIPVEEKDISHHVMNEELDWLIRIGRVKSFNINTVWLSSLPERPQKTIE